MKSKIKLFVLSIFLLNIPKTIEPNGNSIEINRPQNDELIKIIQNLENNQNELVNYLNEASKEIESLTNENRKKNEIIEQMEIAYKGRLKAINEDLQTAISDKNELESQIQIERKSIDYNTRRSVEKISYQKDIQHQEQISTIEKENQNLKLEINGLKTQILKISDQAKFENISLQNDLIKKSEELYKKNQRIEFIESNFNSYQKKSQKEKESFDQTLLENEYLKNEIFKLRNQITDLEENNQIKNNDSFFQKKPTRDLSNMSNPQDQEGFGDLEALDFGSEHNFHRSESSQQDLNLSSNNLNNESFLRENNKQTNNNDDFNNQKQSNIPHENLKGEKNETRISPNNPNYSNNSNNIKNEKSEDKNFKKDESIDLSNTSKSSIELNISLDKLIDENNKIKYEFINFLENITNKIDAISEISNYSDSAYDSDEDMHEIDDFLNNRKNNLNTSKYSESNNQNDINTSKHKENNNQADVSTKKSDKNHDKNDINTSKYNEINNQADMSTKKSDKSDINASKYNETNNQADVSNLKKQETTIHTAINFDKNLPANDPVKNKNYDKNITTENSQQNQNDSNISFHNSGATEPYNPKNQINIEEVTKARLDLQKKMSSFFQNNINIEIKDHKNTNNLDIHNHHNDSIKNNNKSDSSVGKNNSSNDYQKTIIIKTFRQIKKTIFTVLKFLENNFPSTNHQNKNTKKEINTTEYQIDVQNLSLKNDLVSNNIQFHKNNKIIIKNKYKIQIIQSDILKKVLTIYKNILPKFIQLIKQYKQLSNNPSIKKKTKK